MDATVERKEGSSCEVWVFTHDAGTCFTLDAYFVKTRKTIRSKWKLDYSKDRYCRFVCMKYTQNWDSTIPFKKVKIPNDVIEEAREVLISHIKNVPLREW